MWNRFATDLKDFSTSFCFADATQNFGRNDRSAFGGREWDLRLKFDRRDSSLHCITFRMTKSTGED
ncbi:MAG: hypothetical protein A2Y12_07420 [Planctomycetes bacterium GWF2_42_9]|nr:MAG: hypothetical protein A2Y12_07420 [Planctomycetes bacterium GWF2_42_9]